MNPITLVFGSFIVYTAVKGKLASYWALATSKASAPPANQVASIPPISTGQANSVPSPTTLGTAIGQSLQSSQGAQFFGP